MKLLLILSLIGLTVGQAIISKPMVESNDLHADETMYHETHEGDEMMNEKRLDKRSFGWNPWIWPSYGHGHGHGLSHGISLGISHGHGWPSHGWSLGHGSHGWSGHGSHGWSGHGSHGWSGHGLHSGWSIGWPIWYGSAGHGWHSGHDGWHSKW